MKSVVQHEKYGEICYEESFWVGKQSLTVDGRPLQKLAKKVFIYEKDGEKRNFTLKGNYLFGLSVDTGDALIRVVPNAPWYAYLFAILSTVLFLVWGNSQAMALSIFPIVGGAIGGMIIGASFVCYLICSKLVKKPWQQFLMCFVVFLLELAALALVAVIVGTVLFFA